MTEKTPGRGKAGRSTWQPPSTPGLSDLTKRTYTRGSYTFRTVPITGTLSKITVFGEAALEAAPEDQKRMLDYLLTGAEQVEDYAMGVCYDVVAFILALDGRLEVSTLRARNGQNWLSYFDFDSGTRWRGEPIPRASAVGFKRIREGHTEYFHAAVAVGGTMVRGVNATGITFGWPDEADLNERVGPDNPEIQVWYLPSS
ncbi:hypothetical protein [Actinophytocola oryzae]|uniref:Uncharacterized protein n=1 Tax=Actinophytocola oryzae TaxID=502181 RepID=A0A4V3FST7_9PSEU|nr:hypothetical protein [Actinophytocola oryzae]TDV48781.1 hypothetical protein CLV71_108141 [Actinophytocola oryzae]